MNIEQATRIGYFIKYLIEIVLVITVARTSLTVALALLWIFWRLDPRERKP